MEPITSPFSALLQEPSPDIFHAEARAWGTSIDFWKTELSFFRYLLHHHRLPEHEEKRRDKLLEQVKEMSGQQLENLAQAVAAHEVYIGGLMQEDEGIGNPKYIREHHKLAEMMGHFDNDLRKLKREIFDFERKF
ncbi:MAG: hypothetical protein FD123_3476 [Bacteroidetes bacterium]|nr:MAG: hypothetical protein FD123_3476 [Bacteroidota bacterium]